MDSWFLPAQACQWFLAIVLYSFLMSTLCLLPSESPNVLFPFVPTYEAQSGLGSPWCHKP
jgi:hypothetical protein